jgi:KUP system potassium uptake protein
VLKGLQARGVSIRPMETTYYLGRETLIATRPKPGAKPDRLPPLSMWRKRLFVVLNRNAQSAMTFFNIPANRVV